MLAKTESGLKRFPQSPAEPTPPPKGLSAKKPFNFFWATFFSSASENLNSLNNHKFEYCFEFVDCKRKKEYNSKNH